MWRYVLRAKTDWLIPLVDAAIGVVGHPAGLVLKQANSTNRPIATQIEPMPCSPRHADEVSTLNFDGDNRSILWAHMKQAASLNNEAHLIIIVPVFAAELCEHGCQPCSLWTNVDYVRRDVTLT